MAQRTQSISRSPPPASRHHPAWRALHSPLQDLLFEKALAHKALRGSRVSTIRQLILCRGYLRSLTRRIAFLERVTKPPTFDSRRRSSVNRHGRRAASRSVVGSCGTSLADSPTTPTGWSAARLGSRVPDRHSRMRADLLAVAAQDVEDRLRRCTLLRRPSPGRRLW
jgi:hypothetical protein